MSPATFAILVGAALVAAAFLVGYCYERRAWNGGVCRGSGRPWIRFDTDSQGGRGYVDDPEWGDGVSVCWISWPGIDTPPAVGHSPTGDQGETPSQFTTPRTD